MTSRTYEISLDENSAISEIRKAIELAQGHLSVVYIKHPDQAKMSIFRTPHLNIDDKLFDLSLYNRISKLVVEQYPKEYAIRLVLENDLSDTNIGPELMEYISELIKTIDENSERKVGHGQFKPFIVKVLPNGNINYTT